eukprot:COSAG06_NODE_50312_length_319_cov_1.400000_1_plen_58_part_10
MVAKQLAGAAAAASAPCTPATSLQVALFRHGLGTRACAAAADMYEHEPEPAAVADVYS